jgi:hypothetical protein
MILFFADGRLGNQIFQYAFLQTIRRKNELLVVSGVNEFVVPAFDELKTVFKHINAINIKYKSNRITRRLYKYFQSFIKYCARIKIISHIYAERETVLNGKYTREGNTVLCEQGLFRGIKLVKLGFFQSEDFFDKKHILGLQIKKRYVNEARAFLKAVPEMANKVFIHIRQGDYKEYKIYDKTVLLPMNYFHECIKNMSDNIKNPYFIFLTDAPDSIKNEFDYLDNKIISTTKDYAVDFAIMTLCNNAILSPSSFGWWGSYFMNNRNIVFAPKHWLGFASGIDYQKEPLASYMRPVEININDIAYSPKIMEENTLNILPPPPPTPEEG